MPDKLSSEDRSRIMSSNKGKGTSLERRLWSMLAGMGIKGWKRNVREVLGTPDVVFHDQKIAIFVDGCYWHNCPICNRSSPATNVDFWEHKFKRNVQRDKQIDAILISSGWKVIRIWEHEMADFEDRKIVRLRIIKAMKPIL